MTLIAQLITAPILCVGSAVAVRPLQLEVAQRSPPTLTPSVRLHEWMVRWWRQQTMILLMGPWLMEQPWPAWADRVCDPEPPPFHSICQGCGCTHSLRWRASGPELGPTLVLSSPVWVWGSLRCLPWTCSPVQRLLPSGRAQLHQHHTDGAEDEIQATFLLIFSSVCRCLSALLQWNHNGR